MDENLSETQCGFVAKKRTRDTIALLKMRIQITLNANREIVACFIDHEEAFDLVNHEKMMRILKKYNVDDKTLRIIQNLYWNQSTDVKTRKEYLKNQRSVKKGLRLGCPLSPRLFNVYVNDIMREVRIEKIGLMINSDKINEVSYADGKVVIAKTEVQIQKMIDRINSTGLKYGMKINTDRTKVMKFTKDDNKEVQIEDWNTRN